MPGTPISGFAAGDTIDLTTVAAISTFASFDAGMLSVPYSDGTVTLNLAGSYTGDLFLLTNDGGAGTDIQVVTFDVSDEAELNTAIQAVDAVGSGNYTISFTQTFTDTVDPTALNLQSGVSVTIDGGNFTLDGGVQGAVTRRLIPGRPIWRSLHTGENRPSDRSD